MTNDFKFDYIFHMIREITKPINDTDLSVMPIICAGIAVIMIVIYKKTLTK